MRVCFESTFEDWAAAQMFSVEQMKLLQRHDRWAGFILIILFIAIDVFLYLTASREVFQFFTLFIVLWIALTLVGGRRRRRKLIYRRLKLAYGKAFEAKADRRAWWVAAPEQVIVADADSEVRIPWASIRQVVLCPEYMFVKYGTTGLAYLPKRLFNEGDCLTFTNHFLMLYRQFCYDHGIPAAIGQDEWTIKLPTSKKKKSS